MSIEADVERVWAAEAVLGEGPTWDRRSNALYWVDIKSSLLHAFDITSGARKTWRPEHPIYSLDTPPAHWRAPTKDDAHWFLGCAACGFGWIGLNGDQVLFRPLAHPEKQTPHNRYNDGKTGPDGRYWAGSMDDGEREASGSFYAFSSDGDFEKIDTGYLVTNGPAFSPDGRVAYHTDSPQRLIYRFDLNADGQATNRQIFRRFGKDDGYPDGMTTDGEGNIWVAMWDGACLRKLSPNGDDLGRISLPAVRTTSCTFADAEKRTLFVTSARTGLRAPSKDDGALFRVALR